MDLLAFSEPDQANVRSMLLHHETVHYIPLFVPIRQRYRRTPPSDYDDVRAHNRQLLDIQVIQEGCSPYASPTILVRKQDGNLRLCVDNRLLNGKTWKDAFPLPRI